MFNWRISPWAMMVAVVAATACQHGTSKSSILTADRLGLYEFSEHVEAGGDAGETIDIKGQAEVRRDSVLVEARPGPCRLDTRTVSPQPFVYVCGTVTLTFDRRDPITGSSYSVTLSRNGTRQVCVRNTTNSSGRPVCAEYRNETIPTSVRMSGSLHLTRVPE